METLRIEVSVARTPARPGSMELTAEVVESAQQLVNPADDSDTETTTIAPGRRPPHQR